MTYWLVRLSVVLGLLLGVPLLGFYFWCANQFMVQRVLSARSVEDGRRGVLLAGLLKLPVLFIMVLPGTMAIHLYPDLPRPDLVYPTLMFDLLVWVQASSEGGLRKLRSDLRYRIDALFAEAGVVIAFPQRDVHLDGEVLLRRAGS